MSNTPYIMRKGVSTLADLKDGLMALGFAGEILVLDNSTDSVSNVDALTLASAVSQAAAGDVIAIMPGYTETLAAVVTMATAGVSVIGLGIGDQKPAFTVGAVIDGISLTADDILVENIRFETPSAAATSNINIAASDCVVRGVTMVAGANFDYGITVTAAGEKPTIENCDCTVTANGPVAFVDFEGVIDRPVVRNNIIIGSDGTNEFDNGCLDFSAQAITNPIVIGNIFDGQDDATPLTAIGDVGAVVGDCFSGNYYAGGTTNADTVATVTATIGAGAIVAASFGAGAIDAAAIADNAIDANAIAASAITAAKIDSNAITADKIANDAITSAKLATDSITDDAIAASAVTEIVGSMNGTTTDTISGKIGTDTEMADRSLFDLLGSAGFDTAFPVSAVPGADVSLGAVLHDIWDAVRNGTGGSEPATNKSLGDYLGIDPAFYIPGLGYRVTKTESIADDTTTADLFTVTGKVLLTLWTGEVTTSAVGADLTDYKLRVKTANIDLCAVTDIHGAADGYQWQMSGDNGDTLLGTPALAAVGVADLNGVNSCHKIIGNTGGTLTLQSLHTDPNSSTASISHILYYLPLDAASSVAAV